MRVILASLALFVTMAQGFETPPSVNEESVAIAVLASAAVFLEGCASSEDEGDGDGDGEDDDGSGSGSGSSNTGSGSGSSNRGTDREE